MAAMILLVGSSKNTLLFLSNYILYFLAFHSSYAAAQQITTARILLYTATADFRHDSIPTAIQALHNQSSKFDVTFDATEDKTRFTDDNLASYDAIMFVSTTGEVLDDSGKSAFQNFLNKGGNFIGVHSASDTLRTTQFYEEELGAYFDYHPALQNATVDVIGPSHPSTSMLPAQWHVQDEMYNFKSDPRSLGAVVILSANESSYVDTGVRQFNQGTPHPTAWYQEHGAGVQSSGIAGRSFYTSLGHLNETWEDNIFMAHVMGGVMWALQANTTKAFNASAEVGNTPSATSTVSSKMSESAQPSSSSARYSFSDRLAGMIFQMSSSPSRIVLTVLSGYVIRFMSHYL